MKRCISSGLHACLRYLFAVLLVSVTVNATAGQYKYQPDADPVATYTGAVQQATEEDKLVLVIFGSEWCPDCRSLNRKLAQPPARNGGG